MRLRLRARLLLLLHLQLLLLLLGESLLGALPVGGLSATSSPLASGLAHGVDPHDVDSHLPEHEVALLYPLKEHLLVLLPPLLNHLLHFLDLWRLLLLHLRGSLRLGKPVLPAATTARSLPILLHEPPSLSTAHHLVLQPLLPFLSNSLLFI